MPYNLKNLIFEGGGVKGIAYIGAIEELQAKGIIKQIERVGGTSAGAINAVLIGLNYSVEDTKEILWKLNFNNFMSTAIPTIHSQWNWNAIPNRLTDLN